MNPLLYVDEAELFRGLNHLAIDVEDDFNVDLLKHFDTTNAYISDGLEVGGGVFVHWWVDSPLWLLPLLTYFLL